MFSLLKAPSSSCSSSDVDNDDEASETYDFDQSFPSPSQVQQQIQSPSVGKRSLNLDEHLSPVDEKNIVKISDQFKLWGESPYTQVGGNIGFYPKHSLVALGRIYVFSFLFVFIYLFL